VAVTGAVLAGYVFFHLLGNLQIYLGPDKLNSYAAFLKNSPGLLWGTRLVLLLSFALHIWGIARLTLDNRAARPAAYAENRSTEATFASRTMLPSGAVLLAFVVYHLLHFTIGVTHPEHYALKDSMGRHDVYSMVVLGFQQPLVSLSYIVAMGLLGLHLVHGIASIFQTLGVSGPRARPMIELGGRAVALFIVAGNILIPLSCLLGWVQPATGGAGA